MSSARLNHPVPCLPTVRASPYPVWLSNRDYVHWMSGAGHFLVNYVLRNIQNDILLKAKKWKDYTSLFEEEYTISGVV